MIAGMVTEASFSCLLFHQWVEATLDSVLSSLFVVLEETQKCYSLVGTETCKSIPGVYKINEQSEMIELA